MSNPFVGLGVVQADEDFEWSFRSESTIDSEAARLAEYNDGVDGAWADVAAATLAVDACGDDPEACAEAQAELDLAVSALDFAHSEYSAFRSGLEEVAGEDFDVDSGMYQFDDFDGYGPGFVERLGDVMQEEWATFQERW